MRVHFWRRHVRETVIILEEGNLPHPRCENCDMLVPWRALNGRHKNTAMCKSGVERKRRRLAEAEIRESTEMASGVYGEQIESVPRFTYLGRVMMAGDDDWPACCTVCTSCLPFFSGWSSTPPCQRAPLAP